MKLLREMGRGRGERGSTVEEIVDMVCRLLARKWLWWTRASFTTSRTGANTLTARWLSRCVGCSYMSDGAM